MYMFALFAIEQSVLSVLEVDKIYPASYRKIAIGQEVIKTYHEEPVPGMPISLNRKSG